MKFLASLLLLTVVLCPSSSCTQNLGSDQKQLETMVVELYQAMVAKDRNTLEKLTAETLSYGHSSGTLENKAAYIEAILNGPFEFLSIDPVDQTISVSGDTAIVPAPSFPIHVYAVVLAAGNVISLDCRDPQHFLERIAYTCEHLFPAPKLVIVNYPHNPSTTCVEQEFYAELVVLAKKYNFMVISDFAYADMCFDGYKAPSFLTTPGAKDVGVEFTTMSKGYSMAGWRIGFCAGNPDMVRALATIKGYYDYGIFQAAQIAAIVAQVRGLG